VKLYRDLAKGIDPSSTLRFFVMVLAASLLTAEVEGHCATDTR
jgi:hypothetical protein